jgi:predicted acylesterase/phospholipase RssA
MGGTLFLGRTCGAFTAGVMAMGLRAGEIEHRRRKVVRMLGIMTVGGDAFGDDLNAFNRSMNRGYALSKWFRGEFGSTQCQAITGCDLSDPAGVSGYIEGDQVTRCRAIAGAVAERVEAILAEG